MALSGAFPGFREKGASMAFGIFGKNNSADLVIRNAKIWTGDPDLPEAGALACKEGRILAVGEEGDMDRHLGKHTEVLDLEGRFVTPGISVVDGTPVLDVFRESCLMLHPGMDRDQVLDAIEAGLAADSREDTFFGFGYRTEILKGLESGDAAALLDGLDEQRPILILSHDGYRAWLNTPAIRIAQDAAEEEGMEILTLPFTLSVLNPFHYEELQQSVVRQAFDWASRGVTCIYNSGSPDPFDNIYQNILVAMDQEGILPQRHFGSMSLMAGVNPEFLAHKLVQVRNKCIELDGIINADVLHIFLDGHTRSSLGGEALQVYCRTALERGFDVLVQVEGKELLLETLRDLAGVKAPVGSKSTITLLHNERLTDEERYAHLSPGDIFEAPAAFAKDLKPGEALLTGIGAAADRLGLADRLGTISPGKYADFAVFDRNPFESATPEAAMTFMAGNLVYDRDEDSPDDWNQQLHDQQYDEEEPDFS